MYLPTDFWPGILTVAALTGLSILSGKITLPGAIAGFLLTLAMFLGMSWYGIILLSSFFTLGTLASLWKRKEKEEAHLAQEKGGKRGLVHALANGGVAGVCGLAAWLMPEYTSVLTLAMTGSIAAATSDTFSSELGNVYGRRYWDILSWKAGTKGDDGIVSREGSIAGLLGAGMIAILFGAFFQWQLNAIMIVLFAGLFGNLIDSLLGASLQRNGLLDNHAVNFFNTLAAALLCLLLA